MAAAVVGHLTGSAATCPNGFVNFGDGNEDVCIFFFRAKDTWHGMKSSCQLLGSDLATLTGNLHTKVIEYINDQPAEDLRDETFWIGGTDEVMDGTWRWTHDNSQIPLGTPHWYPCNRHEEPDGGTSQNFLCLPNPKFYFHSCDGNAKYMGICQIFPCIMSFLMWVLVMICTSRSFVNNFSIKISIANYAMDRDVAWTWYIKATGKFTNIFIS
ncbi:hypothetical protein O3P69_003022 [Scylla paramamosain]|uniref:C-type lectin domain-containing protein n=1 Tax=Scylla paramamosain TaxID=85552 RepID=A0AAW0UIR3_SCYPA